MNKVLRRTRDFCSSDVLNRTLTPEGRMWVGPHLKAQYPWEIEGYLRQHPDCPTHLTRDAHATASGSERQRIAALRL